MDLQYLLLLQHLREDVLGGAFNDFALQISDLSYGIFIWLYACVFFWAVNKRTGSFMFLNVGTARFLMQSLKLTFCVYRPWIRSSEILPIEYPSGYSFPSGHSVTSTANFGTLARQNKQHKPLAAFLLFMAALTIFSRNFIGAHTPQDVAVGGTLGILVVIFASRLWEWIDADPRREVIIPIAGAVLSALFLAYITLKSYPMDYADGKLIVDPNSMVKDGFKDVGRFFGLTVGWFLERRFVRFTMDVSARQKALRCCCGALLLILYEKTVIPAAVHAIGSNWGYFFMMGSELIVLLAVYPWVFQKLEGSAKEPLHTAA